MLLIVFLCFHLFYLSKGYVLTAPSIRQISLPLDHAEGPTWDARTNLLYFVDLNVGRIFSYHYYTRKIYSITVNGAVTPVVPSKNNPYLLVAGVNRSVVAIEWDGKKKIGGYRKLMTVSKQFPKSRFNDGKADSQGRLWFGTMGFEDAQGVAPNQGFLYKITRQTLNVPSVAIAPVNISNGLTWNKANTKLYYIDTPTRKIVQYDFNSDKGTIQNAQTVFDLNKYKLITGNPDGMTIDEKDNLWVALYGGGAVICVNPKSGKILQVVPIPALFVTSVIWGGSSFEVLFVTTSRRQLNGAQRRQQLAAGSVFAVTGLGVKGVRVYEADIIDSIEGNK